MIHRASVEHDFFLTITMAVRVGINEIFHRRHINIEKSPGGVTLLVLTTTLPVSMTERRPRTPLGTQDWNRKGSWACGMDSAGPAPIPLLARTQQPAFGRPAILPDQGEGDETGRLNPGLPARRLAMRSTGTVPGRTCGSNNASKPNPADGVQP